MKKIVLPCLLAMAFAACTKNDITNNPNNNTNKTDTLQGNITADMTLDADKAYLLKGQVYVKNNATLTIPAGTTIYAEVRSEASAKSALIITQGAKLNVNGTASKPVVFTSAADAKVAGDWGAVIILGNAPANVGVGHVAGLAENDDTRYGGSAPADNSGTITYLRLEYTGGINPPAEDEWAVDKASGLVLAGVGSATVVDNVMVKYSNDDSYQFVGGTVNATHLISYNCGDDDFDFDHGFTGRLQFLVGYRTKASSQALRANGFESYNDSVPTVNTPLTRPVVSNMTIIGPQGLDAVKTNINQGVYMRKGTRLAVRNSIIAEYSAGGFMVCPRTRPVIFANDNAEFRSNLVEADTLARTFCFDQDANGVFADPELELFETNPINNNSVIATSGDMKLQMMYTSNGNGAPNLSPVDGSPALAGADFTGADFSNTFFAKDNFRGAIGSSNWAAQSAWADWK